MHSARQASIAMALCVALTLLGGCDHSAPTAAPDSQAASPASAPAPEPAPATTQPTPPVAATTEFLLPGSFDSGTTVEELQQRFGAANVSVQEVPGAEGESFRGVRLFPDDPERRATLYFQDEKNLRGLSMVRVDEPRSRWKLASGIGIGTSLADLQARNGKPFAFSGFDWDYGGSITDWRGGKLQAANDNPVSERMQLRMPEGGAGDKPYPMGDSEFASDDPRWKNLGIAVGGISVGFPGEDDL